MVQMTHLGGPTVLLELGGWRILTDPTFDPPGRKYQFGWGTSSIKTAGPALQPDEIGPVDVVLLSHDHHADNLDDRGRDLLPAAGTVLTTRTGARRLAAPNVHGLGAGETTSLDAPGKEHVVGGLDKGVGDGAAQGGPDESRSRAPGKVKSGPGAER